MQAKARELPADEHHLHSVHYMCFYEALSLLVVTDGLAPFT